MIRITVTTCTDSKTRVIVEGRITRASSIELADVCQQRLTNGDNLEIDLSAVTFVDSVGVSLVRDLVKQGCVLGECAGLVRALVADDSAQLPMSSDTIDEGQLLAQLRGGEEAAFEHIVRRYGGRMHTTARRFLNNEHDAEDAVQEAFASAFRALDKFNGRALLSTWLHRIVVNAALVQLRSKKRKGERTVEELLPRFDQDGEWIDNRKSSTASIETILDHRDSREMVRRSIAKLPAIYRSVVLLRDIEQLDTDETARSLAITPNTVKVRLHRARQALKTLIEQDPSVQSLDSNDIRSRDRGRNTSLQAKA